MKIKKNGKVIRLNESDLKRIVKRTLNEQDGNLPPLCNDNELSRIKELLTKSVDVPIKIQTGTDAGVSGRGIASRDILVITDGSGQIIRNPGVCGCKKEDWA